jgi:hypothetical protein
MHKNLPIKPELHPTRHPFVFHGDGEPHPTAFVSLHMKVHEAELSVQSSSINFHFLWLVMQFIPFSSINFHFCLLECPRSSSLPGNILIIEQWCSELAGEAIAET